MKLLPGDTVTWTDPDNGECSRKLTIRTVDADQEGEHEGFFCIEDTEGGLLEAYEDELSLHLKVTLDNQGSDADTVLAMADCEQAKDDQTIDGASWECDGELGYAMLIQRPTLVRELLDEGYTLDLAAYDYPEEDDDEEA